MVGRFKTITTNRAAMSIKNKAIYQSFVDPEFCVLLWNAGMQCQTSFMWQGDQHSKTVSLFTSLFDPDNYYEQAAANIHFVTGTLHNFAAFQLGDMERVLPDYTICRTGTEYMLCMGTEWKTDCVKAERLPDAFALMVLQLHKERKLDLHKAIDSITLK